MTDEEFPIMGVNGPHSRRPPPVAWLPWAMIAPHERQALDNHGGQTLRRLAERGGLAPSEAIAVLEDRPWRGMDHDAADRRLVAMVDGWKSAPLRAEAKRLAADRREMLGLLATAKHEDGCWPSEDRHTPWCPRARALLKTHATEVAEIRAALAHPQPKDEP